MKAFTLIEILVVIAIVALLAGLIIPIVTKNAKALRNQPAERTARTAKPIAVDGASELEPSAKRFVVESHGEFRAGYGNNIREILTIKDRKTGKEYIGITGVGVTELVTEASTSVTIDSNGNPQVDTTSETIEP